jgi:retron-type reverse transcriptase
VKYSDVYDFTNLYNAYLNARRQKKYRKEVLAFSYNLETNLIALQRALKERAYRVGKYRPFIVEEPKRRQIVALPFVDRIVQWALCLVIEPAFEQRMIADSFACRTGKGTAAAVKRLSYFMGKPGNVYYLKLDVKSFFASIDRGILKSIVRRYIEDEGIIRLLDAIFDSSPVPGLPIGNLMSQLFANVYLHELDHHCKNALGVKYYLRYMDDVIILSHGKAYLRAVLADIKYFLASRLVLALNQKTHIGKCGDGIEFVGFRVWRGLRMVKKQSMTRMRKKVKAWKNGKIGNERFMRSIGSWMGHSVDTSSYRGVMRVTLDVMREMNRRAVNGLQSQP